MKLLERHRLDKDALDTETVSITAQIKADMAPVIEDMQQAQLASRKNASWHADHSLRWVVENVQANQAFDPAAVKAAIAANPVPAFSQDEEFGLLSTPLGEAFKSRPAASIAGWISGRTKEQTMSFNAALKQAGPEIKTRGLALVESFKASSAETAARSLATLSAVHAFYSDVVQAVRTRDAARFQDALKPENSPSVPEDVKARLFATPIDQGKTPLQSLGDFSFPTIRDEAAVLQAVVASFQNDVKGMRFLADLAAQATDDVKRERFQAYMSSFTGTIIPFSPTKVINANNFSLVEYAQGTLSVYGARRNQISASRMSPEEAAPFLDAFSSRPNVLSISDISHVNMNSVAAVFYQDERLKVYDMQGQEAFTWTVNAEKFAALASEVLKRPNFVKINDTHVININACGAVLSSDKRLRVYNTSGSEKFTWSTPPEAMVKSFVDAVASRAQFAAMSPTQHFNINSIAALSYDGDRLVLYNSQGGHTFGWSKVSAEEAAPLIEAYAKKPGVIKINDNNFVNAASWSAITYIDGQLGFRRYSGSLALAWKMDQDEAQPILAQIAKRPNMLPIFDAVFVNANSCAAVSFYDGSLRFYNSQGSNTLGWKLPAEEAAPILDKFKQRPNFVGLFDQTVINANSFPAVVYESGSLSFRNARGSQAIGWQVNPARFEAFVGNLRTVGQTNALKADFSDHKGELKKAFASSGSSSNSYSNDGTLLPLMAAAFLLASTSEAYASEHPDHDGFTSGEGGDYAGGGASGDFPEETEGHDPDTAEADADGAADTEIDTDGGADADMGDGGSDPGCDAGGTDGGGGGGGGECTSDPQADRMFADLIDGGFGRGRQRGQDFELR